jgi:hypothetical protein
MDIQQALESRDAEIAILRRYLGRVSDLLGQATKAGDETVTVKQLRAAVSPTEEEAQSP